MDKIKENKDEGKLYPDKTGIDEEGSGTDKNNQFKEKDQVPPGAGLPPKNKKKTKK